MTETSKNVDDDKQKLAATTIKHQLAERKQLHFRRRQVNDFMCVIALFGLVLMLVDTELRFNGINSITVILIRPLISISTILLVGLVFYYHAVDIRLYTINNHLVDWRIALNIHSISMILCEVLVCIIHPFPYNYRTSSKDSSWVEMFLTLPMFARLYLIARSVTLHSQLVNTASSQTIGYLNRVPITISFILRACLQIYPAGIWSSVMILVLLIFTWSLRACERGMWLPINSTSVSSTSAIATFSGALWMTMVTFTTVGYGDLVPQTYCGQGISTMTAFFGLFASAVLVAVFTRKISLNRSEQVVLDFVTRINRARAYRQKTMEMIQYSVRAWFLKRNGHHYRATFNSLYRLHAAIRQARLIKQEQRNATNGTESFMTVLNDVHDEQKGHEKSLAHLKQHMGQLEDKMSSLEQKLDAVLNILTQLAPERQHSWL